MPADPSCDIIIPVWNQPERTQRCLEALRQSTNDVTWQAILVDNGSNEPTTAVLQRFKAIVKRPVHVIRNPENLGFVKAANQGLRASSAPYVVLLNNDTVPTDGWLSEMLRVANSSDSIGLVNPNSNTFGSRPAEASDGGIAAHARALAGDRGQCLEMATAVGFCLLIKRAVITEVGAFDESFGTGNFEDADFSKRACAAGYRCVLARGAYVYHEEKVSFRARPGWEEEFRANQQRFYQRWGRPLRIFWETRGMSPQEPEPLVPVILKLLREGHWVAVNANGERMPHELRQHLNAARVRWGRMQTVWHILKRRKKPVDIVITNDPTVARWLQWLQGWHRATILHGATPSHVEHTCRRLSRSQ